MPGKPRNRDIEALEETARHVAHQLNRAVGDGVGFFLFLFEFEGNWATYISNGERAGMVKALRELLSRLEGGN